MKVEMIKEGLSEGVRPDTFLDNFITDILKYPGMPETLEYAYSRRKDIKDQKLKEYYIGIRDEMWDTVEDSGMEVKEWDKSLSEFVLSRWSQAERSLRHMFNMDSLFGDYPDWPICDIAVTKMYLPIGCSVKFYRIRPISFDVLDRNYGSGVKNELMGYAGELQRAVAHYLWQLIGDKRVLDGNRPYRVYNAEFANKLARLVSRMLAVPIQLEHVRQVKVSDEFDKWWRIENIDGKDDLTLYYNGSLIARSFKADPNV